MMAQQQPVTQQQHASERAPATHPACAAALVRRRRRRRCASSVLPTPYALSRTGALVGLATMLLVALCNDYTTCLMINAAYATGHDSFESLAMWAGGRQWKVRGRWM